MCLGVYKVFNSFHSLTHFFKERVPPSMKYILVDQSQNSERLFICKCLFNFQMKSSTESHLLSFNQRTPANQRTRSKVKGHSIVKVKGRLEVRVKGRSRESRTR